MHIALLYNINIAYVFRSKLKSRRQISFINMGWRKFAKYDRFEGFILSHVPREWILTVIRVNILVCVRSKVWIASNWADLILKRAKFYLRRIYLSWNSLQCTISTLRCPYNRIDLISEWREAVYCLLSVHHHRTMHEGTHIYRGNCRRNYPYF